MEIFSHERNYLMKICNRLYFGLLLFACILFISGTSHAVDKSLDQGLNEIAQQITESIPSDSKKTIAVMDFNTLEGNVTMFGRYVGEKLITKLFQTKRFKVIERGLLEKALQELKFNTTDLVDTANAKQLGKVVGADAIVTGTLTDLGQSVEVNARVITVESGEVIGAASEQLIKDTAIKDLLKKVLVQSTGKKTAASNDERESDIDPESMAKTIEGTWDVFMVATKCTSCQVGQRFHAELVINLKDEHSFSGTIKYDDLKYADSIEEGKIVGKEISCTRIDHPFNSPDYRGWFKGLLQDDLKTMRGTYTDNRPNEDSWTAKKR